MQVRQPSPRPADAVAAEAVAPDGHQAGPHPGVVEVPQQPQPEAAGVVRLPQSATADQTPPAPHPDLAPQPGPDALPGPYPQPDHEHPDHDYPQPDYAEHEYSGQAYPQPGYPDSGFPGPSHPQPDYPQPDYPEPGYPSPGYPGDGQPGLGYPMPGYPQQGHPGAGHPDAVYPGAVYPGAVYPGAAYPEMGYPHAGYPAPGQPIVDHPGAEGRPVAGHPVPAQQGPPHAGPPHAGPPHAGPPPAGGSATGPGQPPPGSYPEVPWPPEHAAPTAEEFARRRATRPADPVAKMGVRAAVNKTTLGLVRLPPGRHEQEVRQDIDMVRRNFGGLRQVTVVNPKGGAGKTVAILLLAMTFGQRRGGYVLAWDNNETQGTLGMRAQQDFHSRTVRDMLRDLGQFQGAHGRVGDLSQYVRSQGEGMFDVLASDESATGGEMLTAEAFAEIREVVSRFYKLIFVDTGNNVRAQNWQAAIDATDQLLVTMSARNDSAETAARMLDHLEQSGRQRLVRQAVTVVSMPPSRKELDLPAIQRHFAARTRAVLFAPYERLIDTGEPIRYGHLSSATRDAWLKIAAAVAEGL
nr:chromosome partitioning protein [Micromonospora sp. DSM 115978]